MTVLANASIVAVPTHPPTTIAGTDRLSSAQSAHLRPSRWRPNSAYVLLVISAIANLIVALDAPLPVVRPVAGLFLLLVLPTYMVLFTRRWESSTLADAVLCSFGIVLLGVILGGLAINQLLPALGIERPLDRVPILVSADLVLLVLAWSCQRHWSTEPAFRTLLISRLGEVPTRDRSVLAVGVLLVIASIAGAIRLNNGTGGAVTTAMLFLGSLLIVALLRWRWRLLSATILVAIYLLALALLLMTSLRGWTIVGHDSQVEFDMFELTEISSVWRIQSFQSAYNACLSITIFPVMLSRLTGLSGVYVLKLLFPIIFALCPVIVYLIARRFGSRLISIMAAVYFIAFPTFFTDMPFLNRQAIAFVFLGLIILVLTNQKWRVKRRQLWIAALSVGVVISHYSTTYILIAIFMAALGARFLLAACERLLNRLGGRPAKARHQEPRVVGAGNIVFLVLLSLVWTGLITNTGGTIRDTTTQLMNVLGGSTGGQQSSDVSYSLLGGVRPSPDETLQAFVDSVYERTLVQRAEGEYYPLDVTTKYRTAIVEPDVLPLTFAGRALEELGVNVPWLNTTMRQGAARLLQVFIGLGLLVVLVRHTRGMRITQELFCLSVGAIVVLALMVVLPTLSVDYGVLRAFQQVLFLCAPLVALGSIASVSWVGDRRSIAMAGGLAVSFFLCLTGVVPQVIGGYGPQLHLNNAGEYYDIYYPQPEEEAAAVWLERELRTAGSGVFQTQIPGRLTYDLSSTIFVDRAVHPVTLRKEAHVLLGVNSTVHQRGTVWYSGDLLTYRYPIELLEQHKDLIYSSGSSVIYR